MQDVVVPELLPMAELAAMMRLHAARGLFTGRNPRDPYLADCMWFHRWTGAKMAFTRDTGHHSSGWWKNPDYERCFHLSISFWDGFPPPEGQGEPTGFKRGRGQQWAEALFGNNARLCWIEPPYTKRGKIIDIYHYRLFCDAGWQPIKPRGEVYDRRNTPAEWKSFSDLHGAAP